MPTMTGRVDRSMQPRIPMLSFRPERRRGNRIDGFRAAADAAIRRAMGGTMPSIDQLLAIRSLAGSEAPRWLPDGQHVVIASGLGGGSELWAVPAVGGAPRRLTVG